MKLSATEAAPERRQRRRGPGARSRHHLPLPVVAEAPRLDDGGKPGGVERRVQIRGRVETVEGGGGDAQFPEHLFLGQPVLGGGEGGRRRERRKPRSEVCGAPGRDILELVGDDVRARGDPRQTVRVVVRGPDHRAERAGGWFRGRLQEGEAAAQGNPLQGQHAGELPAAENGDPHGSASRGEPILRHAGDVTNRGWGKAWWGRGPP